MHGRPSFIVVTITLCIFALLGAAVQWLAPKIPAAHPNRLSRERSAFLLQGSAERVNWFAFSDAAFAEARHQDRPIFLAIGSPASAYGRGVDRDLFTAKEIVNYLNRNYICIRADAVERPDLRNAFWPVSRMKIGFTSGVQYWILDSQGHMYRLLADAAKGNAMDRTGLLELLAEAREAFDDYRRGEKVVSEPGAEQREELKSISLAPAADLDFADFGPAVQEEAISPRDGGMRMPRPITLRYLLLTGRTMGFAKVAEPMMHSGLYDLMDGGFFRAAHSPDWTDVEFDKVALTNADLCVDFAMATTLTGSHSYRYVAEQTFDSLVGEFVATGDIAAVRVGDEKPMARSERSSFSPNRLLTVFPDPQRRSSAIRLFGLDPRDNSQVTCRWVGMALPTSRETEGLLETMRSASPTPHFADYGFLSVNAGVVARLIQSARLLNDPRRLTRALQLCHGLTRFRLGGQLEHAEKVSGNDALYLEDFLAYSEAMEQAYLATGDKSYAQRGLRVLRGAVTLFQGHYPGHFLLARIAPSPLGLKDVDGPELLDSVTASCTSRLAILCSDWGRLAGDAALVAQAKTITQRFGYLANRVGEPMSGLFCAGAQLKDDAYAIATSQSLADALLLRCPQRLILPDPTRAPGIYVVRRGAIEGPMGVAEAATALGPMFRLD